MILSLAPRRAASAVLFAAVMACAPASAADLKLARQVVEVSGAASSFKDIVAIFLDEAKRTFVRTNPELSGDLDQAIKTLMPEFEQRREQLLDQIAGAYAARFSDQELMEIKTFYETPTGAKLVKALPGVLQESYDKTNVWSRQMSQDVVTRLREELKKKGHDM
ncbi:DUF2059 domain-containing protein [Hansschlegelia beijingensis]|uniref:DUF2059 domain-containing protein n=1 Tax=Hansschlegelia beijingensis TaxID=1133344 RepID=UPI0038247B20